MKLFSYFITLIFLFVISGIAVFFYGLWYFGKDLPDYKELSKYNPDVVTRIHAGNGALLAEYATQKRVFVPINVIPKKVIDAFISAEDKDFYNHFGIDLVATLRALITNVRNIGTTKRLIGASTITQQVAKNFLLSSEMSYERKIKEAILAIRIERAFSKNEILELYLNEIYLGFKSYGVAAASLNYFDKSLDDLDLSEAAFLAALPKAPNNYNPIYRKKQATIRRNWVLSQMSKNGFIEDKIREIESKKLINIRKSSGIDIGYAPYFTEEVRKILFKNETIGSKLYTNGYSVRTTLDPSIQLEAEEALIEGLEKLDKRQGWRGPINNFNLLDFESEKLSKNLQDVQNQLPKKRYVAIVTKVSKKLIDVMLYKKKKVTIEFKNASWVRPQTIKKDDKNRSVIHLGAKYKNFEQFISNGDMVVVKENKNKNLTYYSLSQIPNVNGAIVALDPNTGRVLAMSGGYNFQNSEFNRATQAKRQPGSAFKPFVYLAGLERNYKPTDLILDAALAYDQCSGCKKWKPANYTKKFYGPSPMRLGIEKSRNLMTARLAIKLIEEEEIIKNYIDQGYTNNVIAEKLNKDIYDVNLIVNYIAKKRIDKRNINKNVIQDYADKFGITENLPSYLSMSLGAGETDLLSITTAYGMIINGGKKITPTLIDRVQDRRGNTIFRHDKRDCKNCNGIKSNALDIPKLATQDTREKIISSSSAYQMVSMLQGAVNRGTGKIINSLGKNLAGKTGTTNANTDAWFVGFSSDLVAGIFVGFDDPRPLGYKETGSSVAAPIFRDFMKKVLDNTPDLPFRRPAGIKLISVNPRTGLKVSSNQKGSILEAFKPGQLPNLNYDNKKTDIKNTQKNLSPLY
ncbi:MAG: penicillin-binding protein [Rhodospirillaceae bacterium]|nr:penicillin-binding protein [Rhodospirillaceae bacterium]